MLNEVILCSVFRRHVVRESGSLKFRDRMSPFIEIKFQLSCHVSFNPAPRSLMSQGSPSWTVKVAGTTSTVLEDTAWSTAARWTQHRTTKQACRHRSLHVCNLSIFRWKYRTAKASGIMTGDDSDHDPGVDVFDVWTLSKIQDMSRIVQ